jgi:hypothetical protein
MKVRRKRSCCSAGKAWSLSTSSSGLFDVFGGGAGFEPLVDGWGLSADIGKTIRASYFI